MIYKQPISVLVVIFTTASEFLLMERAKQPGFWQSVTGSRDGQEDLFFCAKREVYEETGLDEKCGEWRDLQQQVRYPIMTPFLPRYAPGTTENTEHWFSLRLPVVGKKEQDRPSIRLQPNEHLQYGWYSATQAMSQCFSPSNRDAIAMVSQLLAPEERQR